MSTPAPTFSAMSEIERIEADAEIRALFANWNTEIKTVWADTTVTIKAPGWNMPSVHELVQNVPGLGAMDDYGADWVRFHIAVPQHQ